MSWEPVDKSYIGEHCQQCGHLRHIGRCHADVDRESRCTCDTLKGRPEENQFIGRQNYYALGFCDDDGLKTSRRTGDKP